MSNVDFRNFSSCSITLSQTDIVHYGMPRRSGRYPYGSGDRPYQSTGGTKRGIIGYIQKRKDKKNEKALVILEKENEKNERIKKAYEGKREEILRKGTAADVLKLHEKVTLTPQEIQTALNRINVETQLRNAVLKEKDASFDKVDRLVKKAGKMSDWGEVGIKIWDQMASVYNATDSSKNNKMPYIKNQPNKDK